MKRIKLAVWIIARPKRVLKHVYPDWVIERGLILIEYLKNNGKTLAPEEYQS